MRMKRTDPLILEEMADKGSSSIDGSYKPTPEDLERLKPCLAWLPDVDRDIFWMVVVAGISASRVARWLGLSQPCLVFRRRIIERTLYRINRRLTVWMPVLLEFLAHHQSQYRPIEVEALVAMFYCGSVFAGGRLLKRNLPDILPTLEAKLTRNNHHKALEMLNAIREETFKRGKPLLHRPTDGQSLLCLW